MSDAVYISPSQLEKWDLCNRKWAFRYIGGIKEPQSGAAEFGEEFHLHLENWERYGTLPPGTKAGELAKKMLPLLPPPKSDNVITETNFSFPEPSVPGLFWTGKIDLFQLQNPKRPKVTDYKTTGDKAWMKTPDMLLKDPQSMTYGAWAFDNVPDAEAVELEWLYAFKRGGKPEPVRQTITKAYAFEERARFAAVASEMVALKRAKVSPMEIRHNTKACDAFGGCAFVDRCNITPSERFLAKMAQENEFITRLRKEREAKEAAGPQDASTTLSSIAPPSPVEHTPAPTTVDQLFAQQAAPSPFAPLAQPVPQAPPQVLAQGVVPPDAPPRSMALAPPGQMSLEAKLAAATPGAAPVIFEPTQALPPPIQTAPPLNQPPPPVPRADLDNLFNQVIPTPAEKPAPAPQQAPPPPAPTPAPAPKKTSGTYGMLLLDALIVKGAIPATALADIILPFERKIAAANNIADYRLIDYAQGGALLSVMLAEELDRNGEAYGAITADSFAPSYKHLADVLTSRAAVVMRGV